MRIGRSTIRIAGRSVPFERIRSRRARLLRLEYCLERGVVAVLPPGTGEPQLQRFITARRQWLRTHIEALAPIDDAFPRRPLMAGRRLLYLGRPHLLRINRGDGSCARVLRREGVIHLALPRRDAPDPVEVLERWYRRQARAYLTARVDVWAERLGLSYRGIAIRNQKRRWGSCTTGRRLSFNWRLMLAPPRVVDYVVVHELTHIEQMSHSPAYWRKIAARCPNYRAFEAWLGCYGPVLTLGREPDGRRCHGRLQAPPWGGR